jgi:hypothetical protein
MHAPENIVSPLVALGALGFFSDFELVVDHGLNSYYQYVDGVFWAEISAIPSRAINPAIPARQFSPLEVILIFRSMSRDRLLRSPGCYAQKFDPKKGWKQAPGPEAQQSQRAAHPPPRLPP